MFVEIEIANLKVGMYLIEIIKPKGKFQLLKSALVKNEKTITLLQNKGVELLLVDPARAQVMTEKNSNEPDLFQEQIAKAKSVFNESKNIQKKLFYDAENGSPLDLSSVNKITDESIDLIFENPDALACVLNLRNKDEYLLEHSVAVSVLITMFSFYLEIDKSTVRKLAVGAFLHDVGKIKIPDSILNKPGKLTVPEFEIMKTHASHSIEIIKNTPGIDPISLEVVALHHEQLTGNGYPHGVKEISLYGRIIAICDIFDALTSTRCYKEGMSQVKAFGILRNLAKSNHLDVALVDKFIRCMGVYPVGAIVQLDSNRLAIVEAQNQEDPINPKVTTFYSLGDKGFEVEKKIDLAKSEEQKIVKCVRADDFDLDMNQIIEYLAHQG
ncbi:HD-GYP domain-containing protein [Psychromonas sp. Urea-02u-13]|uniref:HD-GYP domain-containing protein n=1 Tax=Psychromonas sp. Urea-02u-13 TaxID=2058326 RepID=UPI000C338D13|nr:HD-GYP domain-containing protein [Psychromonas sp. Urea-02u-13]PKG38494.1 phosphohydrolase [Psychromonas sp. Urea-02u-13]